MAKAVLAAGGFICDVSGLSILNHRFFTPTSGEVPPLEPNLISICSIAFGAVFVLLSFLAAVMQLITLIFPAARSVVDQTIVAAISSTVTSLYPGARVTKIEEES